MNLFWAALIVVLVAAVATTGMLLVRRRAPAGSYFEDGDRAAGVFGVLATGFAVLLGFVVFLAFESFDTSRSGAVTEAQTIAEQFETAQLMPAAVRGRFSGELICYARSVVHQEWPKMQSGGLDAGHNPWGLAMFQTLQTVQPLSAAEQAAYGKWLDQRTDRETARADRAHGAEGVIPTPLWIVLFLSSGIIFVFMLFFADSAERSVVQGTMMGSVRGRDHLHAASPLVPRSPVQRERGRAAPGRDGTDGRAADAGAGPRERTHRDPLRCPGREALGRGRRHLRFGAAIRSSRSKTLVSKT
jgi:hypothetical protein